MAFGSDEKPPLECLSLWINPKSARETLAIRDTVNYGVLYSTGNCCLETAFSRDQEEKIYVQDRLLQHGREVFEWLEAGAHFYVCGDAKSMAASVQQALLQIVSIHGRMTPEAAQVRLKELQRQDRYHKDVY